MGPDDKVAAQEMLVEARRACPVGVYRHHKVGGTFVVHGHSVDEATLVLLVHYYSWERGSWWTRPVDVFLTPLVPYHEGRTRFERTRNATPVEMATALNPEGTEPVPDPTNPHARPAAASPRGPSVHPPGHLLGSRVPRGGSMCANCAHIKVWPGNPNRGDCDEENFVRWNDGKVIPGRTDEYCCDNWEAR